MPCGFVTVSLWFRHGFVTVQEIGYATEYVTECATEYAAEYAVENLAQPGNQEIWPARTITAIQQVGHDLRQKRRGRTALPPTPSMLWGFDHMFVEENSA